MEAVSVAMLYLAPILSSFLTMKAMNIFFIFQLVGRKLKTPVQTRWNSTFDSVSVMNKILKEPEARLVSTAYFKFR